MCQSMTAVEYPLCVSRAQAEGPQGPGRGRKVAGMIGRVCAKCRVAYFGTPPGDGLCGSCGADDDRPGTVPVLA
jgi:hypothetical protein